MGHQRDRFRLDGKSALVTGASRGLGAAIAIGLAEAGADVAICARSVDDLDEVARRIRNLGRRALAIACDVTQRDAVRACATRAWDEHGPTDVLVNNAGGPLFQAPFLEVREEGWLRVLELNLNSVYRFCQATGGRMVAQGSGAIVNIASALPTRAWPRIAAYSAAKAAVLSLSQSLAVEWGPLGIRVNAVCPGWINTELNRVYTSDPRRVSRILDAVPLAHMAEVDDVVGSVLWLASDAAKYVTGINLPVDGGLAIGISREWLSDMARFTTPIDPSEHDTRTASGPGVSAGAFIDLEDT